MPLARKRKSAQKISNFTRVYLMRHPEVVGHYEGKFWGHSDVSLSRYGKAQMKAMAQRMGQEKLAAVYCSNLQRTRQVAEAIGRLQRPRLKPQADPAFRELNLGIWEGLTYQDISERYPDQLAARARDLANFAIEGGESLAQLSQRVLPAFWSMVEQNRGKEVCLVAHAGVNRVILVEIMGAPLENVFRLDQEYGCLNIIDIFEDGIPLIKLLNQAIEV